MPIVVESGLTCSGGSGRGAMVPVYGQGSEPSQRLHDYDNPEPG
jgi:hypothetical protein